jgi:hypothetical protein
MESALMPRFLQSISSFPYQTWAIDFQGPCSAAIPSSESFNNKEVINVPITGGNQCSNALNYLPS